jgi:hypothetical protein
MLLDILQVRPTPKTSELQGLYVKPRGLIFCQQCRTQDREERDEKGNKTAPVVADIIRDSRNFSLCFEFRVCFGLGTPVWTWWVTWLAILATGVESPETGMTACKSKMDKHESDERLKRKVCLFIVDDEGSILAAQHEWCNPGQC